MLFLRSQVISFSCSPLPSVQCPSIVSGKTYENSGKHNRRKSRHIVFFIPIATLDQRVYDSEFSSSVFGLPFHSSTVLPYTSYRPVSLSLSTSARILFLPSIHPHTFPWVKHTLCTVLPHPLCTRCMPCKTIHALLRNSAWACLSACALISRISPSR
ncbi:hypothetical protein BC835DRAFT_1344890 [Cytidiella melzeri]|nr:hypothetical protein BC835DRAFT_1344890 [Cytidiella melzeri]